MSLLKHSLTAQVCKNKQSIPIEYYYYSPASRIIKNNLMINKVAAKFSLFILLVLAPTII